MENEKKVLLSLKDVEVKFKVRGRILTAIRGVTMDIYDGETIAIVGESGSGKSVLTKTFSGMLDGNGFISNGSIILNDEEISKTVVKMDNLRKSLYSWAIKSIDDTSKWEMARELIIEKKNLKLDKKAKEKVDSNVEQDLNKKIKETNNKYVEALNNIGLLDKKMNKESYDKEKARASELKEELKRLQKEFIDVKKKAIKDARKDVEYLKQYKEHLAALNKKIDEIHERAVLSEEIKKRNETIAKEVLLSVSRYGIYENISFTRKLLSVFRKAVKKEGATLSDVETLNSLFDKVNFRVEYKETLPDGSLSGYAIINLAKVKNSKDWQKIRGDRIATVFQDPMTSLNPIIPIGKQITQVILKHQNVTPTEAKRKALEMMEAVGINDPEKRFDDYPFQYSGGMRQRIVIAIALSCNPKILICDEPTTALDVTIQAQILKLIKNLQKRYGFTTVYITHDFGVVANVAERVAVLYAGQVIEYGMVEEIFYDPKHPYTWALLSSLPQLSVIGEKLYSIDGTPPSLYNKVVGDAFAPRNPYCMKVDLVKEPPYFKISDTHYAKTWLCDPRAPKVEKPKNIQNLHESMSKSIYNVSKDKLEKLENGEQK